jgi:hypothetical protein
MIAMYLSFGTLLYPFLGQGHAGAAYGTFPSWSHFTQLNDLQPDLWLTITGGLVLIYLGAFRLATAERVTALCLTAATVGGTMALLWATAGYVRYTLPFTVGAGMVLATDIARQLDRVSWWKGTGALVLAAAIAISAPWVLPQATTVVALPGAEGLLERTKVFAALDRDAGAIRRAQQSIPEGKTVMAKIARPFLLDFSRNNIHVIDWAHGASPRPGMPLGQGSDALAEYLLSVSIMYVLYEHDKPESWYPGGDQRCREAASAGPILSRTGGESGVVAYECSMDLSAADFIRGLDPLMETREVIYDDGRLAVIDLTKRRPP